MAVVNDARAIERCVDKSMTSFLLARAGLPTPPTWVAQSAEEARAHCAQRGGGRGIALVLKPLFGAQGRGLRLLDGGDDLPEPEEVAGVYYLQRFVGRAGPWLAGLPGVRDGWPCRWRRCDAAGGGWITNVGQGGRAGAGGGRGRAGGARSGRGGGGRGRPCRRRPDRGCRGRPADPRGQQHAGLAGPAERHRGRHRPRAGARRSRAAFASACRLGIDAGFAGQRRRAVPRGMPRGACRR